MKTKLPTTAARRTFWRWRTNTTERLGKLPDPETVALWAAEHARQLVQRRTDSLAARMRRGAAHGR